MLGLCRWKSWISFLLHFVEKENNIDGTVLEFPFHSSFYRRHLSYLTPSDNNTIKNKWSMLFTKLLTFFLTIRYCRIDNNAASILFNKYRSLCVCVSAFIREKQSAKLSISKMNWRFKQVNFAFFG